MFSRVITHQINLKAGRWRYLLFRLFKHQLFRWYIYPFYKWLRYLAESCGCREIIYNIGSGRPTSHTKKTFKKTNTAEQVVHTVNIKPRLLILRPDHIGDFLYSLPSFLLLKAHFSSTHELVVIVDPCNAELANALKIFDEIHVFPIFNLRSQRCLPSLAEYENLMECLGPLDCAIDLRPDAGAYFLIDWLDATTYRICNDYRLISNTLMSQELASLIQDSQNGKQRWYYSRELYASRARLIFSFVNEILKDKRCTPAFDWKTAVSQAQQLLAQTFFSDISSAYPLVLCLEARDPAKVWPIEETRVLLRALIDRQIPFVLIGQTYQDYGVDLPLAMDRRGSMTLLEVFAYLCQAECYVGFDSGLAHFSALCGLKTICIYTAKTSPEIWGGISPSDQLKILTPQNPLLKSYWWRRPKIHYQEFVQAHHVLELIDKSCPQFF